MNSISNTCISIISALLILEHENFDADKMWESCAFNQLIPTNLLFEIFKIVSKTLEIIKAYQIAKSEIASLKNSSKALLKLIQTPNSNNNSNALEKQKSVLSSVLKFGLTQVAKITKISKARNLELPDYFYKDELFPTIDTIIQIKCATIKSIQPYPPIDLLNSLDTFCEAFITNSLLPISTEVIGFTLASVSLDNLTASPNIKLNTKDINSFIQRYAKTSKYISVVRDWIYNSDYFLKLKILESFCLNFYTLTDDIKYFALTELPYKCSLVVGLSTLANFAVKEIAYPNICLKVSKKTSNSIIETEKNNIFKDYSTFPSEYEILVSSIAMIAISISSPNSETLDNNENLFSLWEHSALSIPGIFSQKAWTQNLSIRR
ncbi:hypothetical protein AYI70_g1304 [Smittium culicis]|uniref:Uncharacterized protein n=1 Tax=Smittium culicis TaxID=133412 RepID=A0A1R1XCQ2_9FUNG|nr:hypothetical protein AYI70_g9138 [Smittium culicis]OMJ24841.1 hypothetical protein AYI70_g1304 [Smittium culicis]